MVHYPFFVTSFYPHPNPHRTPIKEVCRPRSAVVPASVMLVAISEFYRVFFHNPASRSRPQDLVTLILHYFLKYLDKTARSAAGMRRACARPLRAPLSRLRIAPWRPRIARPRRRPCSAIASVLAAILASIATGPRIWRCGLVGCLRREVAGGPVSGATGHAKGRPPFGDRPCVRNLSVPLTPGSHPGRVCRLM